METHIKNTTKNRKTNIMKTMKYFRSWIKDIYPHAKYTNSLSLKWVIKFAEDYHNHMKAVEEHKPLKKFYLKVDYVTSEIIEIRDAKTWEILRYKKCWNRGGGVNGLYYEIWAEDQLDALKEYDKFWKK